MARTVDYSKKAEKIKEQVDELVQELMAAKSAPVVSKRSLKVADINFENEDVNTLMQIQARLALRYLEKSKIRKNSAKVLIKCAFPVFKDVSEKALYFLGLVRTFKEKAYL